MQQLVTTDAELASLCAALAHAPALALDTEFMRERTYRAELCLVQLATADHIAVVDPIAVRDLAPLAALLRAASPIKVMHASRQDIEVLHPVAGLTQPVFDTQLAAALAGFPAQVGYGELVRRLLGRELSKAHTRTDWSRRPLSAEQIDYALDDVRYLLPLKEGLESELARLDRTGWLEEELRDLADESLYAADPERAWLRVKGVRSLDPDRTRLVRALAAWRERRASERNRPRGWILEDAALREIVLRVPRTAAELAAVPELPPAILKHCGSDILALIAASDIPDPAPALPPRPRPDPAFGALVKRLAAVNQETAAGLALSPEILATRRDLEEIALGRRDVAALAGWRKNVIGARLLSAL